MIPGLAGLFFCHAQAATAPSEPPAMLVNMGAVPVNQSVVFEQSLPARLAQEGIIQFDSSCTCLTLKSDVVSRDGRVSFAYQGKEPGPFTVEARLTLTGNASGQVFKVFFEGVVYSDNWLMDSTEWAAVRQRGKKIIIVDARDLQSQRQAPISGSIPLRLAAEGRGFGADPELLLVGAGFGDDAALLEAGRLREKFKWTKIRVLAGGEAAWKRAGRPDDGMAFISAGTLTSMPAWRSWTTVLMGTGEDSPAGDESGAGGRERVVRMAEAWGSPSAMSSLAGVIDTMGADEMLVFVTPDGSGAAWIGRQLPPRFASRAACLSGGYRAWMDWRKTRHASAPGRASSAIIASENPRTRKAGPCGGCGR
ncbi:hypothetical protein AW736_01930 [Termitidicoccus mucosus]|uniref:Rhodanese domain-containing protein n=1 Tax=Termitidicoccus mucosus TaxID=1184151 RepID=A0A178IPJ9_9BACT|nr:hypothetical protein AW736_01930 [Opitutaceae bacterium TSB47]